LKDITLSNNLVSMGIKAFEGCISLSSVTIPNSVKSIGNWAFSYCSNLTFVSIGNSVESIGYEAFIECKSLSSVDIPNSVTAIDKGAFQECSSLTSVTIGDGLTSIGKEAFKDCSSLTSVSMGKSVASIGDYAFYGCKHLYSVEMRSDIKNIGFEAYANCPKLTEVYCYAKEVPTTSQQTFSESKIEEKATLHVPTPSIESYKTTAPWSSFWAFKGMDNVLPELPKCATPTISYIEGKLAFGCETNGVVYVSKISDEDVGEKYSGEIELTKIYTISVYATKTGYDNSDVATATIGWRNGSPVMEGFANVILEEDETACDVNKDGLVDVADIATIIDKMASTSRQE
jgi:hypothetical protein